MGEYKKRDEMGKIRHFIALFSYISFFTSVQR